MLSTARVYDRINRLVSIISTPSVSAAVGTTYGFNGANQRVLATESSGENWNYSYDTLGQVTGATKKTSGANAIAGQQFGYQFDTIGNRTSTARGNQASSYVLRTNNLNQYASRQVPGKQEIVGSADAGAAVLVNERPASRQGTVFSAGLEVDNTTSPVWRPVSIVASLGSGEVVKEAGDLFIPKTPEEFTYDADGNMTGDGRWTYTWDAENRLTSMETKTAAWQAGAPRQRLEFGYDGQARRVFKKVYAWGGGSFALATSTVYVYDNWNMIAELDALDANAPTRNYAWGLDLSGGFAGAGGVGGLLAIATDGATYAPTYDGNGNVTGLVDFADGKQKATYAYGPFGEVTIRHGSAALVNPFQFSTKFVESESGLVNYGFRYYNPVVGRWLSRDPIQEQGGINLYAFVENAPSGFIDYLGLSINRDIFNQYRWKYNRNSIKVTYCGCDPEAVSRAVTDAFTHFSRFSYPGISLDTSAVLNDGAGIVRFKPDNLLNEWLGHFGGLGDSHDVTVYGPKPGTHIDQRAITNTWHGLVGVRLWGHHSFGADREKYYGIEGWTLAQETWNNAGGYVGGEGQINKTAKKMWREYLRKTVLGVLSDLQCQNISVLSEVENYSDEPLFDAARPNPLLKNIPEALSR